MKFQNFLKPWWKTLVEDLSDLCQIGSIWVFLGDGISNFSSTVVKEIFLMYAKLSIYAKLDLSRSFKEWDFRIFFNHGEREPFWSMPNWVNLEGFRWWNFKISFNHGERKSFWCMPTLSRKFSKRYRWIVNKVSKIDLGSRTEIWIHAC